MRRRRQTRFRAGVSGRYSAGSSVRSRAGCRRVGRSPAALQLVRIERIKKRAEKLLHGGSPSRRWGRSFLSLEPAGDQLVATGVSPGTFQSHAVCRAAPSRWLGKPARSIAAPSGRRLFGTTRTWPIRLRAQKLRELRQGAVQARPSRRGPRFQNRRRLDRPAR